MQFIIKNWIFNVIQKINDAAWKVKKVFNPIFTSERKQKTTDLFTFS